MLIKMNVKGLTVDPMTNVPIVILSDEGNQKSLPIWIGIFEASAILSQIEKISTARPMTHDLIRSIIVQLGCKVVNITITDLKDNTYHAIIELLLEDKKLVIDSRPSDAIAIALRVDAPILVAEEVIEKANTNDTNREKMELDKMKEWLKNAEPEDFGEYKM
jgi:bifunctional DNase/RNase